MNKVECYFNEHPKLWLVAAACLMLCMASYSDDAVRCVRAYHRAVNRVVAEAEGITRDAA